MRFNAVGGIMLSSLDMDDFSGMFCTGDMYPLLHAIHEQLKAPLPTNPNHFEPLIPQQRHTEHSPKSLPSTPAYPADFLSSTGFGLFETTTVYFEPTPRPAPPLKDHLFNATNKTKDANKNLQTIDMISKERFNVYPQDIFNDPNQQSISKDSSVLDNSATTGEAIHLIPQLILDGITNISKQASSTQMSSSLDNAVNAVDAQQFLPQLVLDGISKQGSPPQNSSPILENAANMPTHSLINNILEILIGNAQPQRRPLDIQSTQNTRQGFNDASKRLSSLNGLLFPRESANIVNSGNAIHGTPDLTQEKGSRWTEQADTWLLGQNREPAQGQALTPAFRQQAWQDNSASLMKLRAQITEQHPALKNDARRTQTLRPGETFGSMSRM